MGKSSSKIKKKPSLHNLSWNRFGSLPVRSKKPPFIKHKSIQVWLKELDLQEYEDLFKDFQGVEDLLEHSEQQIKDLGVKKSSHRAIIISSLTRLRAKYHELFQRPLPAIRFSMAPESTTTKKLSEEISNLKAAGESKSLCNLIEMEPMGDPSQNSQELKKALEWELSLDSRDLRSHAWYHGSIPRSRAEEIVREEGSFLVRDCTSQPGNYVLSCRTKMQNLHFVINKLVLQPDTVYERIQFQFEEEAFDTVPDLITFYVGSGKAITQLSGARIQIPKNRMYPLSFYACKYPTPVCLSSPSGPRILPKKQRSQSLTPSEINKKKNPQEKCNSADGVIQSPLMTRSAGADSLNLKFSTHSLPRCNNTKLSLSCSSNTLGRHCRISSEAALSSFSEESPEPPPKPSRFPTPTYHASGSDSGNGSGDSALSSAAENVETKPSGVVIKNPRYLTPSESSTTLKNFQFDCLEAEQKLLKILIPSLNQSYFDLDNFTTLLLPVGENKPLDVQALRRIKMTLKETGSRILANHLTKTDLEIVFCTDNQEMTGKKLNGIELVLLPNGHQLRLDLIERVECLKLLVAITILTCAQEDERTETLNKWIETAIDTKTALGNLFGFCGIMLGLCTPQIEQLDSTWHNLRQKYTDSAFNFEAKLRPTLKNMNSCSNPQAPNTTIPHILPLILLLERNLNDFLPNSEQTQLEQSVLSSWESTQDFGLGTIYNHLESAKKYVELSGTFQRNAEIVLGEARLDELTIDMFRTEFQLKFLWGSRGAFASAEERHPKFEQVLQVVAEKYCTVEL